MIDLLNRFAYVLCMSFSVGIVYFSLLDSRKSVRYCKISNNSYYFFFAFFIPYWTLLLGLQNNVGSDYPTYLKHFVGGCPQMYYARYEFGYACIVNYISRCHLPPQQGFIIFSLIQSVCMCRFLLNCKFERLDIFLLVYFCCATAFINSQNALRQYTAMYIFLVSIKYLLSDGILKDTKSNILYIVLILLATLFHLSAILLIIILPLSKYIYKLNSRDLGLILIVSVFVCFIGMDSIIVPIVKETPYSHYLESVYFLDGNRKPLLNSALKLIYIPFYFFFLRQGYKCFMVKKDRFYINLGVCSYGIKIMSMSSFFLGRFAMYFDCISYIPLYYYGLWLTKYCEKQKYKKLILLMLFLAIIFLPYFLKTLVFPTKEYLYRSVLF